jgi:quercetin dioxygenase-like cupin family protein
MTSPRFLPLRPLLGLTLALGATALWADTPPAQPTGLTGTAEAVALVDLAPHHLAGAPGDYDLRARSITLAPGGAINPHPHAGRPGIVRVIQGTVIEYRGQVARTLKAGEWWTETAELTHWFRNPSTTDTAEIWVVDLVAKKK